MMRACWTTRNGPAVPLSVPCSLLAACSSKMNAAKKERKVYLLYRAADAASELKKSSGNVFLCAVLCVSCCLFNVNGCRREKLLACQ